VTSTYLSQRFMSAPWLNRKRTPIKLRLIDALKGDDR
jgi:hypothetical protein